MQCPHEHRRRNERPGSGKRARRDAKRAKKAVRNSCIIRNAAVYTANFGGFCAFFRQFCARSQKCGKRSAEIPHCLAERFDNGRTLSRCLAGGRAERDRRARFYSICKAAFMLPAFKRQFAKPPPQRRLRTRPSRLLFAAPQYVQLRHAGREERNLVRGRAWTYFALRALRREINARRRAK